MHSPSDVSDEVRGFSLLQPDPALIRASVVLVHGLTGTPAEMRTIATVLHDQRHNVIVPRLSGHGETIDALRRVRPEAWFTDVQDAVDVARSFERPIFLVGLSFGALLVIRAYLKQSDRIEGIVSASCPVKLRPAFREHMLTLLSYLPERVLDLLWVQQKTARREGYLALEHYAYRQHSVGAAARLVKIRRSVWSHLQDVRAPVLLLQDPLDHHLPLTASLKLQSAFVNAATDVFYFPDGQHEIFLGHAYEDVNERIVSFIDSLI